MKVHELAKKFNLKVLDLLGYLKNHGYPQYRTMANKIAPEHAEILLASEEGILAQIKRDKAQADDEKKGMFIGIVFNAEKQLFETVKLRVSSELMGDLDAEVLSDHTSIFGAIVEMKKKLPPMFNENTVKRFK